jgi:hypothetical protein
MAVGQGGSRQTSCRQSRWRAAWASQKRYISLYVMRADVLNCYRSQLADLDVGKGCVRYRSPDAVDFTVVRAMLTAVATSQGPVCRPAMAALTYE